MNHRASLSARPRRTRRIVLVSLAILGLAGAAFAVRRPLMMSAPRCMAGRWHRCYDTENGVLLMMLVGLPLAAVVVWALAHRQPVPLEYSATWSELRLCGVVVFTDQAGHDGSRRVICGSLRSATSRVGSVSRPGGRCHRAWCGREPL
jgi:hypothetical protein